MSPAHQPRNWRHSTTSGLCTPMTIAVTQTVSDSGDESFESRSEITDKSTTDRLNGVRSSCLVCHGSARAAEQSSAEQREKSREEQSRTQQRRTEKSSQRRAGRDTSVYVSGSSEQRDST